LPRLFKTSRRARVGPEVGTEQSDAARSGTPEIGLRPVA
jgi:hypothetical protein